MKHRRQHSVPRCYLGAWADPSRPKGHAPFVWVFTKDGSSSRRKAPQNTFATGEPYTVQLPDGSRDLRIEHGLATVENEFARIRRKILDRHAFLSSEDKLWLSLFVASMNGRTDAMFDLVRRVHGSLLQDAQALQRELDQASPERRKEMVKELTPRLPSSDDDGMTIKDLQSIVNSPQKLLFSTIVSTESPILNGMGIAVLDAPEGSSFITSDTPVVWVDPTAHARAPGVRHFGLGSRSVEVTMPISPKQSVFFAHQVGTVRSPVNWWKK